jgi:hypothetical protein
MLVYMILNEATEMFYVGRTDGSLESRWLGHLDDVKAGSLTRFHVALREWGTEVWTPVILQHCSTLEELEIAEGNWIEYLDARNPRIGYNTKYVTNTYEKLYDWVAKSSKKKKKSRDFNRSEATTTLEMFREWGRKGGEMSRKKSDMSLEELEKYREWGRKGAEKARELSLKSKQ